MKILHIAGYTVERGGTSKVAFDLMKYQSAKGHEVSMLTVDFPGEQLYPVPEGVELVTAKFHWLNRYISDFSPEVYTYLKKHIGRFDIIHIHGIWYWGSMAPFLLPSKAKIVIAVHGMLSRWALAQGGIRKKIFGLLFQKRFLRKADAIIMLTEAEKEELTEYIHLPDDKVHVIPNGIESIALPPAEEINDYISSLSLEKRHPKVLFLSRVHKKKGLDLLIGAFAALSRKYPDAMLIIAGPDEGYQAEAISKIEALKIGNKVLFLGAVSGRTKELTYAMADMFVLPSYSEGLPMAALEAMSIGTPVIVSDQTRIDLFITQRDAGLVTTLKEEEITSAMEHLLDRPEDRSRYIQNARKLVEKEFSPEAINARVLDLYERLARG